MFYEKSSSPQRLSPIFFRVRLALTVLVGLLALFPPVPAQADMIPGTLDNGFDAGSGTGFVQAIVVQPDSKVLIGGTFTKVGGVERGRIARLDVDGSLDTGFDPGDGANDYVTDIALQPDGRIIIAGFFTKVDGIPRRRIARLNADGSLDTTFDPGGGPSSLVTAMALQPDGKVIIGGHFAYVDGVPCGFIARLNADGSLDTSFDPGSGVQGTVETMALQADGKVLIAGTFSAVNNVPRGRVARLNADGSVDATFDPGSGADNTVFTLAVLPNNKVLIGGEFATVGGASRQRIARLNENGSLDVTFDPGSGANRMVHDIALQTDGKVVVGGWFDMMDGVAHGFITRLNADGSVDTGFDPGSGAPPGVKVVAVQPDGKVLIGGWFCKVDDVPREGIARLNADGSVDNGFDDCGGANDRVYAVALQPDGKILVGGEFTQVNNVARNRIARLNADGTLDTGFDPGSGASGAVWAIAVQPDGKVLIGGYFGTVDGVARNGIARLNGDGSLDTSFDPGAGTNLPVFAIAVAGQVGRRTSPKVLIGGTFTRVNGATCNRVARLNADGSLDTGFECDPGVSGPVMALAVQNNGKVIVGGDFWLVEGIPRRNIARLNSIGSLDDTFHPGGGANYTVQDVAVQPDGKVLIGGSFTKVNYLTRNRIARLNEDGSPDTTFDPGSGANSTVQALALQSDGKVLIGGSFTGVGGESRQRVARLHTDGSVDVDFDTSSGANDSVSDLAVQPDGKVVIVGRFTEVDGEAFKRIARLKGDAPPIP
jgi:uncharacterized delta-60 repeat protein